MNEVPVDFAFSKEATLESIEDGMRAVESNIKIALAILAVSLGRIKREGLYLKVAPDYKAYLKQERTSLGYRKAISLTTVGEKFWLFRNELKENEIKLSTVMNKIKVLDSNIADNDPMIWERLKSLSVRQFHNYVKKRNGSINVYTESEYGSDYNSNVSVNGASLSIGGNKLRGLNLNDANRQLSQGKRLVAVWVDDDSEARKVRRAVNSIVDRAPIE